MWLLATTMVLGACGGGGQGGTTTIGVFAAASLTDAFGDMEAAFEATHPELDVELNLAGSSSLREQILDGAPADVFASADEAIMGDLVDAGAAIEPARFATNRLALAVPAGNPGEVAGLDDLRRPDLLIGLCAAQVPCGRLARSALADAGVEPSTDTEEPDVRSLLTKLGAGELDAGLVYATDVAAAEGEVEEIAAPPVDGRATTYPIARLSGSSDPLAATTFIDFVRSVEGRRILADHGFGP